MLTSTKQDRRTEMGLCFGGSIEDVIKPNLKTQIINPRAITPLGNSKVR